MFKSQLFILFIISISDSSCTIRSLYDTGKELWKLHSMLNAMEFNSDQDVNELFENNTQLSREIRKQEAEIHKRIDQIDEPMNFKTIRDSFKLLPSSIILYSGLDTVEIFIQNIDEYYEKFHDYMTGSDCLDQPLQSFTQRLIIDVAGGIQVLRRTVADEGGSNSPEPKNLVSSIMNYATNLQTEICDGPTVISNILVQLFRTVILAEMKTNIMLTFANIYQYRLNAGWKQINSFARMQFEKHFGTYVSLFALNIEKSDRVYLRACDPKSGTWIRNHSFYELEGTFQTTIFRYHWAQCKYDGCNTIWFKKAAHCEANYYDIRSGCSNTPAECIYLNTMQACVLKSGPYKFQYVNSTALGSLGRDFKCPSDNGYMIEDGMGWHYTYSTCACNCYGNHNKISLSIMESRVRLNMVITGLRFFRENHILYIQPREGKLGADGHILRYSERWIAIPKDRKKSQSHSIDRENRVFFFDDLRLPSGFILTGIKFNKVRRGAVEGFAIEIVGVPFQYESGKLNSDPKSWISKKTSNNDSGKALSFDAISSIYTTAPHTVSPADIKYVSLERSTLQNDFGQSTLPLFDAIPIRTHPPSISGGIGIFHKGVEGYAGFISLRLYGIDYAEYFMEFESNYLPAGRVSFND